MKLQKKKKLDSESTPKSLMGSELVIHLPYKF